MFGIDDAAAATLAAGVLGYVGGQQTNDRSQDVAASNNAWSAQQYATRYQTQVKDLEAAGLNPMLAYGQSPGSAPSAQAVQFQNPVSSAMDAVRSSSGAAHSFASAEQAKSQADVLDVTVKKIIEETKNIPDEGKRIRQTVQLLADQAALAAQKGETEVQIRKQIGATISKLKSETDLINFDVDAAKALDNIGRTSKEMKPIVDMMRMFFPTYHR